MRAFSLEIGLWRQPERCLRRPPFGTLTCDDYVAYDIVFKPEDRIEAGCLAHARRKLDELLKTGANTSTSALQRRCVPDSGGAAAALGYSLRR